MNTSQNLSPERIAEIRAFKDKEDSALPPITADFFKEGHFRNPEAAQKALEQLSRQKTSGSVMSESKEIIFDPDVSAWLSRTGSDYSLIINQILREVIRLNKITAML
jgi:uncharacterized protein (DUF4415 family)